MPGSIHITVLEAVDLPKQLQSPSKLVAVKVFLGKHEGSTRLRRCEKKRIRSWDADFKFPVSNLEDKLGIALCDSEGKTISLNEIEVPSILQLGFREEFLELKGGGRLHVKLSFVLTDEEKKKVNELRAAAQREKEKNQKDDMMVKKSHRLTKSIERAYDLKRKEDYCTDNGLRTVGQNKVEHEGKPLDNWEVFSRKKDKEVLSADPTKLSQALTNLKVSKLPGSEKSPESTDRERCSKNKYTSPSTVEGVLCHSSLKHSNIMESVVSVSSSEPSDPAQGPDPVVDSSPDEENNRGADSSTVLVAQSLNGIAAAPETDEQKENRPASLSVAFTSRVEPDDGYIFCHAPEVEECMEDGVLETRQKALKGLHSISDDRGSTEEITSFKVGPATGISVPGAVENKVATSPLLLSKENDVTPLESLVLQGYPAAVRLSNLSEWESLKRWQASKGGAKFLDEVLSPAPVVGIRSSGSRTDTKEMDKVTSYTDVGRTHDVPKDFAEDPGVQTVLMDENSGSQLKNTSSSVTDSRLVSSKETSDIFSSFRLEKGTTGKPEQKVKFSPVVHCDDNTHVQDRPISSLKTSNMNAAPSEDTSLQSTFTYSEPQKLSAIKVEKNQGLLSRLLTDDSTDDVQGDSTQPSYGPVDRWVSVERPPMTWEDALKVAQEARDSALTTKQQQPLHYPLPAAVNLPTYTPGGGSENLAPVGPVKAPQLFTLPSPYHIGEGVPSPGNAGTLAPGGGYPENDYAAKQILDHSGNLKANRNDVEILAGGVVADGLSRRRSAEEELLRWEARLRNWENDAELKVIMEESKGSKPKMENQISWEIDDFEETIRKDFEARLQSPYSDSESDNSSFDAFEADGRWDDGDVRKLKCYGEEIGEYQLDGVCTPVLADLKVEDEEEDLMEEVSELGRLNAVVSKFGEEEKVTDKQTLFEVCEQLPEKIAILLDDTTTSAEKVTGITGQLESQTTHTDIMSMPFAVNGCCKYQDRAKPKLITEFCPSYDLVSSGSSADFIIESLCNSLEPVVDEYSLSEQDAHREVSQPSPTDHTRKALFGGSFLQVLGGVVLAVGLFFLLPRKRDTRRSHTVRTAPKTRTPQQTSQ